MWDNVSPELTILARAQQTVDRWRHGNGHVSFDDAIAAAAEQYWGSRFDSKSMREAFTFVAEAIRRGEGHGFKNREPLIEILRQSLLVDSAYIEQ